MRTESIALDQVLGPFKSFYTTKSRVRFRAKLMEKRRFLSLLRSISLLNATHSAQTLFPGLAIGYEDRIHSAGPGLGSI